MASTRHAPWRKAVLIPAWVVQLPLLFMLAASAVLLLVVANNDDYYYDAGGNYVVKKGVINIIGVVFLVVGIFCLGLTFAEIIMFGRRKLKPKIFVIMNTIKSTIQVAMFIISIVSVAGQRNGRTVGAFSLIVQAGLLLAFIGPLIYGSIIYHRERKGLGRSANNGILMNASYPTQVPSQYPSQYQSQYPPTSYAPKSYPGSYEPERSVGGTTAYGDVESGVQHQDPRQGNVLPESQPLVGQPGGEVRGEDGYDMGSRRELR